MKKYTLLRDGKAAFDEILRCCNNARQSIFINMFIWRDDDIGNDLGAVLLRAADRGVKVTISKDRCGSAFELAEETGQSFFGKSPDIPAWAGSLGVRATAPAENQSALCLQRRNTLGERLLRHPNVAVEADKFKYDHTKYYIIDDDIVFLGGINVEDKEVTADITGRKYHDFMVKISGSDEVAYFRRRLSGAVGLDPSRAMDYILNGMYGGKRVFGVMPEFLRIIDGAKTSLSIMMPYIGEKRISAALLRAAQRGVEITFIIPEKSNLQHNFNLLTAGELHEKSGGRIEFYLTPLMCHGKMLIADNALVTVGSANMNRSGMCQCLELNCVSGDRTLVEAAVADFEEVRRGSRLCRDFSCSAVIGRLEGLLLG